MKIERLKRNGGKRMREIKFRAWVREEDNEYSHMVYSARSISTILSHILEVGRQTGFSDCDSRPHPERYVLMQYTGYKDRNEREVYEGDIYAMEEYRHGEKTVTYWTVVWDETEYGFSLVANIEKSYMGEKYREDVYLPLRAIDGNRMEYAGNIYENPELVSWM